MTGPWGDFLLLLFNLFWRSGKWNIPQRSQNLRRFLLISWCPWSIGTDHARMFRVLQQLGWHLLSRLSKHHKATRRDSWFSVSLMVRDMKLKGHHKQLRQLMNHFVRPFPSQTSVTYLIHEIFAAQDIRVFFVCVPWEFGMLTAPSSVWKS